MENKNTIFLELQSLSPFLAEKRPGNPYEVPPTYFDGFPERMVMQVSEPIVAGSTLMPMDVPAGYFHGLAASILNKIKQSEANTADHGSELLATIGKHTPYEVPSNYFENTIQDLESVYWNESAPSVLTVVGQINTYTVPDGYFKQLPSTILAKVRTAKKQTPVYPLSFVKKVYRYAAAAVLVGIVSVGALMYFKNQQAPNPVATTTSFDINNISIDELQNYLTGHELFDTGNDIIATNADLDAADLKEFLNDMPESALQQYVQEYADPNTN
jgi:hypothetical protein